jgi:hypothetical protein
MSQCDPSHMCHTVDIRHTCHKYYCHVPLGIKCVIGGCLVTNFNIGWGGWAKSDTKAFGKAVSRRQKHFQSGHMEEGGVLKHP